MAIDTKTQETLKNHISIKDMRRRGSPEPSCQLPTAPAHTPFYERTPNHCSQIVYQARRDHLISMPDRCEVCSIVGKVVAHHPDYCKPLYIIWLCYICHGKLHLGKFMSHLFVNDCTPETFENDIEKLSAIETTWDECMRMLETKNSVKGTLQTAI